MRVYYKLKFFNRTFAPKKFCASDCIAQNVVTVRNLFCVNYFYIQFFAIFMKFMPLNVRFMAIII